MQSFYPTRFERDMGCTEAEWLTWLPRAVGAHDFQLNERSVAVRIDGGSLRLHWNSLAPRVLGLVRIPRLWLSFEFDGLSEDERFKFMKRFDLYTQRGGG